MWINGYNSDQLGDLYFTSAGSGNVNLTASFVTYYAYTGPGPVNLNVYPNIAAAVAAAEAFVEAAGFPWLIIGDLSTIGIGGVAAFNFKNTYAFGDSGSGIGSPGSTTNGYGPWANYADARAGILALLGNVQV